MRGEIGRMGERFAPDRLGYPHCAVTEFLALAREFNGLRDCHRVEKKPDADFSDVHERCNSRPEGAYQGPSNSAYHPMAPRNGPAADDRPTQIQPALPA